MNMKKLVSSVAAFAMTASAFAGLATTAFADDVVLDPIKCTQSAGFTDDGATFVLNVKGTENPEAVYWNNTSGQWKGVAVLEFELPAVAADRVKSATLTYSVHNGSSRSGGRTYDVYPASVTIDSNTTADTLQTIDLSAAIYNGAAVNQYQTREDTIPSSTIVDYVKAKANAESASAVQFAFSNSNQALDINPATAKLNITLFGEGVATYPVSIKTTPYAKVTANDTVYYSGIDGVVTLPEAEASTVINYTIEKGGYTSKSGSATVKDEELIINETLETSHLYYEDFNTTGDISDSLTAAGSSAKLFNIYANFGTMNLTANNATLSIYNGGTGNRSVSYPMTVGNVTFEANIDVIFPDATAWVVLRDGGNQVLGAINRKADGTTTFGASGTGYNTFNGEYSITDGLSLGNTDKNVTINVKVDMTNSKVTATIGEASATVENFAKADGRGSYNGLKSILIGCERTKTIAIDGISVDEYEAPVEPEPEEPEVTITPMEIVTEYSENPAAAWMAEIKPAGDTAISKIVWKITNTITEKYATVDHEVAVSGGTDIVMGLVIDMDTDDVSASNLTVDVELN